jgi:hypothetical protein
VVDKELAIWCLTELSALALSKGDAERAARLTGAMEPLREEAGHAPDISILLLPPRRTR